MILEGELTPLSKLSSAFLSPPSIKHLLFAYFESMLAVEYIVSNYGFDALKNILLDLSKNIEINKAISTHTESIEKLEKDFEAYAKKLAEDLAPEADLEEPEEAQMQIMASDPNSVNEWLKNHPNNLWALKQHAQNLINDNKLEQAKEPLNKFIELFPENIGPDSAYIILSQVYQKLGKVEQEKQTLENFCKYTSNSIYAYTRLMEIAIDENKWEEVAKNCERYIAVNPHITSIHLELSRANEKLGRDEPAIAGYKRLLKLDYPDPADINYRIGRLLKDKDLEQAKRYVLSALAEAPRYRDAHKLLLKIIEKEQESQSKTNDPNESPAAVQENIL
jgi:tetratricopeptide (TPR) repeat protein